MRIIRKTYGVYQKIRDITKRKNFQILFTTFLTTLLFFGVFNAYAAEGDIKFAPAWKETKIFHNLLSGLSKEKQEEDNMNSFLGTQFLNGVWAILINVIPEATPNYAAVLENDNIPYDLKRGLMGMVEDAGTAVYANYPVVNIPEHLAQQWVPGYDESVNSLYAANSASGHPSGYSELQKAGISNLWRISLNISYVFFVIIMIIAGFMIMFRQKIGGQMMVTLGSVLPRVIVSLIIATFSFAIAGFIVDLGGVVSGLVSVVLGLGEDMNSINSLGQLMGSIFNGGLVTTSIISGATGAFGLAGFFTGGFGIAALASNPATMTGLILVGAIGMIIALAIVGIILTGAIKVLITLFKAYFGLLFGIILGPIQITLGAIPGNNAIIKNWFLSILRNVMVFPVVLFIINVPNALLNLGTSVNMRFPGKLVFQDPATYDAEGITVGSFFIVILKIFVLFFAAQAPKYLETLFPPAPSKAMAEGVGSAKASMSKIPLIGGLFK